MLGGIGAGGGYFQVHSGDICVETNVLHDAVQAADNLWQWIVAYAVDGLNNRFESRMYDPCAVLHRRDQCRDDVESERIGVGTAARSQYATARAY
jgi:hypothetical protein